MTDTRISAGRTANGITVEVNDTLTILNGGSATNTTVHAYFLGLIVSSGGAVLNTTVDDGIAIIYSGGTADVTSAINQGEIAVDGTATNTRLATHGSAVLDSSTAQTFNTTIESGGIEFVLAGSATGTTVNSNGFEFVSGGTASRLTVNNGGDAVVFSGGAVNGVTVHQGGTLIELPGSVATGVSADPGGAIVSRAAIVELARLNQGVLKVVSGPQSGDSLSGVAYVLPGAIVNDAIVGAFVQEIVFSGAVASGGTVGLYGEMMVSSGGLVDGVAATGGNISISGGSASHLTIGLPYSAGSSTATFSSGALIAYGFGNLYLESGGRAENVVISELATADVDSGAVLTNAVVSGEIVTTQDLDANGNNIRLPLHGILDLNGGTTIGAVLNGGIESVSFSATASNTTVNAGGTLTLSAANLFLAHSFDTIVNSGGTEIVGYGAEADCTTVNDGGLQQLSGGTANGTVVNTGGTLRMTEGTVNGAVIGSGSLFDMQFGSTTSTTLEGGSTLDLVLAIDGFEGTAAATVMQPGAAIDLKFFRYSDTGTASLDPSTDVLTITEGDYTRTLSLAGSYAGDQFTLTDDNASGTLLTMTEIQPPTPPTLSTNVLRYNEPNGSVVATIDSTDPNNGGPVTFALFDPNGAFGLDGDQLIITDHSNLNPSTDIAIGISATNAAGLTTEQDPHLTVLGDNQPSQNITLSTASVPDSLPAGAIIGTLQTQDPDSVLGETFTYAVVNDPANLFAISGDTLRLQQGKVLDATAATSESVGVQVTDSAGHTLTRTISLSVTAATRQSLTGGDGNDTLVAGQYDTVTAGAGDDVIALTGKAGTIDGGAGYDVLVLDTSQVIDAATVTGIEEYHFAAGGTLDFNGQQQGVNVFVTGSAGAGGATTVFGTDHSDTLINQSASPASLSGGDGDDWLFGKTGDTLLAGAGDDVITETVGPSAFVDGGSGYNVLVTEGDRVIDAATVQHIQEYHFQASGSLSFTGQTEGVNVFVVDGGIPSDTPGSTVTGTAYSDTLINKSFSHATLNGGDGNDWLFGKAADTLLGGGGDDVITVSGTPAAVDGGAGTDILAITGDAVIDARTVTNIEAFQVRGATAIFLNFDHSISVAVSSSPDALASVSATGLNDTISLDGLGTRVDLKPGGSETILGFHEGRGGDILQFDRSFGFSSAQEALGFAKDLGNGGPFSIGQGVEFDFDAAHGGGKVVLQDATLNWLSHYNITPN